MRLDKFLKLSRLIKRRTVANKLCDAKKVSINGKVAKAATTVKVNDVISLNVGSQEINVRVVKLLEITTKSNASEMYEII